MNISEFFNRNYSNIEHYWWKSENRLSLDEEQHTQYYATILQEAKKIKSGNALDLGAGEGMDSIRLSLLGFNVEAIDISSIGIEKIKRFASQVNVYIQTKCIDIGEYHYHSTYDIILCNGVLHYIEDKKRVITQMQNHTKIGGVNCISLFSTYTNVPECHRIVPVYPDDEGGIVEQMYNGWDFIYKSYDRNKVEASHNEMPPHTHSFIKFICRRVK